MLGRGCDWGNVYCLDGCASEARRESLRLAARRYSATRGGRERNAERQRRHRERRRLLQTQALPSKPVAQVAQEKVTHQGSAHPLQAALLAAPWTALVQSVSWPAVTRIVCQRCRRECLPFVRRGFLRPVERGRKGLRAKRLLNKGP